MTEEDRERVTQIRERRKELDDSWAEAKDIDFLLLLFDSQAAVGVADDLPYRIIEEMGLGLTFRSCTCGQLPCARLRPLRNALETVGRETVTRMRDRCVEKVKELRDRFQRAADASVLPNDLTASRDRAVASALTRLLRELQSLTLDQAQEKQ